MHALLTTRSRGSKTSKYNVPLHAAGSKKISSDYVDEFSETLRKMATKLGNMKLLALLDRDVRSSELYYHNHCHTDFNNKYRYLIFKESLGNDDPNISNLIDFVAIGAVKQFVDESNESSFSLKQLENIYLEKMHDLNQKDTSHTTRFAQKLEAADIGLKIIQKSKTSKYIALKTERLDRLISETDWIKQLRNVVDPIRDEIIHFHCLPKSPMTDLSTESYGLSCPKLKLLITLLCLGRPEVGNVPLPFDAISQIIVLNTSQFSRPSRVSNGESLVRHSRDKECPINQYMTLKLYSIVRSKTLVQILFQFGIVLSYDRILTFVNELSQVVQDLYAHSCNKVLPSTLRVGIFTIFIDDNLDKNSSSVDAKTHFHGTAMSVV